MAQFTPSQKTAQDFNGGVEYVDGTDDIEGDAVQAETVNNLIESQLFTQGLAINEPDVRDANKVGTVSVSIIMAPDGTVRLKFSNLKGKQGVGITSILPNGTNANGDNIYQITLDDGRTYPLVAPKGAQGDPANIDELKRLFIQKAGDTMTGILNAFGGIALNDTTTEDKEAEYLLTRGADGRVHYVQRGSLSTKLYKHNLSIVGSGLGYGINATIYSNSIIPYTLDTLKELVQKGGVIPVSGRGNHGEIVTYIKYSASNLIMYYVDTDFGSDSSTVVDVSDNAIVEMS